MTILKTLIFMILIRLFFCCFSFDYLLLVYFFVFLLMAPRGSRTYAKHTQREQFMQKTSKKANNIIFCSRPTEERVIKGLSELLKGLFKSFNRLQQYFTVLFIVLYSALYSTLQCFLQYFTALFMSSNLYSQVHTVDGTY